MPKTKKSVSFSGHHHDPQPDTTPVYEEKYALRHALACIPIHGLVVLFGMFHRGLTTNVKPTLNQGLAVLVLLQLIYGYFLSASTVLAASGKKIRSENVVLLVGGAMVMALVATGPVFVVAVLMGAPLWSHLKETALFCGHFSVLVLFPVLVFFRFETATISAAITRANAAAIAQNPVLSGLFGAVLGTWLGVFPIPLDWDRDWQLWPITLVTGMYVGHFLGTAGAIVAKSVLGEEKRKRE